MNAHLLKLSRFFKSPLGILLLIYCALRIIGNLDWISHGPEKMKVYPLLAEAYHHFWASLFFQHFTPPLGFIINGIVFNLGQPLCFYVMMALSLAGGAAACAFLFLSCRALNVRTSISFIFTLGYSLAMARVLRDQGLGWLGNDEPIYVLLPCFIWYLIRHLRTDQQRYDLHLSVLSGLMLWTSSVPGTISLLITAIAVMSKKTPRKISRRCSAILIPVALLLVLCFKNYYNTGIFNICTKGAGSCFQMTLNITSWPPSEVDDFAKNQAKIPLWWRWCFNQSPGFNEKTHGQCFGPFEPYDFGPLHQALIAMSEPKLAQLVLKDAQDSKERPWIFYAGLSADTSRRFQAHYYAQGQKIWLNVLLKHPLIFINGVLNRSNQQFIYYGPLYGFNRDWYTGLPFFDVLTKIISVLMLPVLWGGIGASYMAVAALLFTRRRLWAVQLLATGFVLTNIMIVIAACCENARMFWLGAAFVVPVAAFTFEKILMNQAASLKKRAASCG